MKRVFAVLLAFVMLVSFAACGKGSKDGSDAKKNKSGNAVAGYVGIEAKNDEGKIIAAADRTLFGSSGLSVELEEDGETLFNGSISFADLLAMSGLSVEIDDEGIRLAADGGKVYVVNDDYKEYFTLDIAEILSPSSDEFNALVTEMTGHSVDDWIGMLSQMGIDVDFKKVAGWVNSLVNGSINEDVIAEVFDTVAIPYLVYILNAEGIDISESDIPDFKTLKGIIYDFFLDGHASSALEIDENDDEYEVTVNFKALAENAVDYLKSHEKLQKLVNSEIGQYVIREFEEELYYIDSDDSITFTVEITDGFISRIEFYDIEIKLSDFNNVDTKDDFEAVVDDADDYELIGEINNLDDIVSKM